MWGEVMDKRGEKTGRQRVQQNTAIVVITLMKG
jgi:hypothetical protein